MIIVQNIINSSLINKLKAKDLKYFNFNFKSEYNKLIINLRRYIYYRNIFI